jgi:hypothetical protein
VATGISRTVQCTGHRLFLPRRSFRTEVVVSRSAGESRFTAARFSGVSDDFSKHFTDGSVELGEIEAEFVTTCPCFSTANTPITARRVISHRKILIARSPKGIP